jgi:hypothetical protein
LQRIFTARIWRGERGRNHMKKFLFLAAALLVAGTAHAQASVGLGGGMSGVSFPTVSHIGSILTLGTGVDQRASCVTSAKNDGPFMPSSFQSYDEAIAAGQKLVNAKPASLGEIARQAREEKKAAPQVAVLVISQDERGRMIASARLP